MRLLSILALVTATLALALPAAEAGCSPVSMQVGNNAVQHTTLNIKVCPGKVKPSGGGTTTQTVFLKGKVSTLKVVIVKDSSGAVISRTETIIRR